MSSIGRRLSGILRTLLLHRGFRRSASFWRYWYYRYVKRLKLKVFQINSGHDAHQTSSFKNAIDHNYQQIWNLGFNSPRGYRMANLISCISDINLNGKALVIGPRTENDLISLYAVGYPWKNLRGLDLFSYSPKIDVGDMHQMPYEDDTFDVAIHSWALTYGYDAKKGCEELVRIVKPGGVVALGCGYRKDETMEDRLAHTSIKSINQIKGWFGKRLGQVYWQEVKSVSNDNYEEIAIVFQVPSAKDLGIKEKH